MDKTVAIIIIIILLNIVTHELNSSFCNLEQSLYFFIVSYKTTQSTGDSTAKHIYHMAEIHDWEKIITL